MCVCPSVTTLAATSFTFKQKIRYHTLLYDVCLDLNARISPKRLRSGNMAVLACPYDRGHLLSIENTPGVLDTTRTDIVRKALATASKIEQFSFTLELLRMHQNCRPGTMLAHVTW